jgi:hypothetical protein
MFLPQLLTARGHHVDIFWDEAWRGGQPIHWLSVADHDVIIMFQSYCHNEARSYRSMHPNVVYIPMFDQFGFSQASINDLSGFWEPFQGSKVLSFSTAVHALTTGFGIFSHRVRYYPEFPPIASRASQGLHGFFWLRREEELGWDIVRALIGRTRFDSFHLHVVGDPGFPPVRLPPAEDVQAQNITMSTWFERRAEFDKIASCATVYFAPRLAEGIGQTFLEAMARGQCVIAADNPTMNEYIVNGVNGLLYEPSSPRPLDLSDVARLGREARRGVTVGRAGWEANEETLVDFLLTPSAAFYRVPLRTSAAPATSVANNGERRTASGLTQALRSFVRKMRARVRKHSLD